MWAVCRVILRAVRSVRRILTGTTLTPGTIIVPGRSRPVHSPDAGRASRVRAAYVSQPVCRTLCRQELFWSEAIHRGPPWSQRVATTRRRASRPPPASRCSWRNCGARTSPSPSQPDAVLDLQVLGEGASADPVEQAELVRARLYDDCPPFAFPLVRVALAGEDRSDVSVRRGAWSEWHGGCRSQLNARTSRAVSSSVAARSALRIVSCLAAA